MLLHCTTAEHLSDTGPYPIILDPSAIKMPQYYDNGLNDAPEQRINDSGKFYDAAVFFCHGTEKPALKFPLFTYHEFYTIHTRYWEISRVSWKVSKLDVIIMGEGNRQKVDHLKEY